MEGLRLISTTFFANSQLGSYVFADNKGFLTMIRRDSTYKSERGFPNIHSIGFFRRKFSGFSDIKLVKQQFYLTLFTSQDKIGFMRAFDGLIAPAFWSINGTTIKSIDFDQRVSGKFYVAATDGHIYTLRATTIGKNDIRWDFMGKIQGNPLDSLNVLMLKNKLLLSYSDASGAFQVFNITKAASTETEIDYSEVFPISFTPNYPLKGEKQDIPLSIVETPTESGHELVLRIPGKEDKLILLDVINKEIKGIPVIFDYIANRGFMFALWIVFVACYLIWKNRWTSEDENTNLAGIKKQLDKNKSIQEQKLEEISKKLAFFEKATNDMSSFNSDIQGAFGGEGDLKPNLVLGKKTSTGSKKNVRFADEY